MAVLKKQGVDLICPAFGTLAECRDPKTECRSVVACGGSKLRNFRALGRQIIRSSKNDGKVRIFDALGLTLTYLHTFSPGRPPTEKSGMRMICTDEERTRWDMKVWMMSAGANFRHVVTDWKGNEVEDTTTPIYDSDTDFKKVKPPFWDTVDAAMPYGVERDKMAWWVLSYGIVEEFEINVDSDEFEVDVVNLMIASA